MRDIHSHILPGVDDGARDLEESLAMIAAARRAGVTSIVCTPHFRAPYFDYDGMWDAYELLVTNAGGFPLQMGFEVNASLLDELGMDWAAYLHFDGSDEFLLELPDRTGAMEFARYERMIYKLQGMGYDVIIAHPERCRAIQHDIGLAEQLVRMGCTLQASCDFIDGGRFGEERKPAVKMYEAGLYTYLASDAHCVAHYECLARALGQFPAFGSTRKGGVSI